MWKSLTTHIDLKKMEGFIFCSYDIQVIWVCTLKKAFIYINKSPNYLNIF